jgi:phage-related minor tail protein
MFSNVWPFANGGIMDEFGSVPLKKYANGGVANSPQLALFGEGKQPEAYVPLPDGRTIPVTLKGGVGGAGDVANSVMINITVHNDGNSNTQTSGNPDELYKRMSERIKTVVREELMNESRPGGVLYK